MVTICPLQSAQCTVIIGKVQLFPMFSLLEGLHKSLKMFFFYQSNHYIGWLHCCMSSIIFSPHSFFFFVVSAVFDNLNSQMFVSRSKALLTLLSNKTAKSKVRYIFISISKYQCIPISSRSKYVAQCRMIIRSNFFIHISYFIHRMCNTASMNGAAGCKGQA